MLLATIEVIAKISFCVCMVPSLFQLPLATKFVKKRIRIET